MMEEGGGGGGTKGEETFNLLSVKPRIDLQIQFSAAGELLCKFYCLLRFCYLQAVAWYKNWVLIVEGL